jgi:hypothetical protein
MPKYPGVYKKSLKSVAVKYYAAKWHQGKTNRRALFLTAEAANAKT